MYIKYNDVKYHCVCIPSMTMVYRGLPDDFLAPVSGEITLCADDGFVLRKDNTADYLRQTFEDGTLVLTNEPEPEPVEEQEEVERKPTAVQQLRADVDYIAIMTGVEL